MALLRGVAPFAASSNYSITPTDIDTLVSLSEANGIDPTDVAVVLYTESAGFNPQSMGPGGTGAYTGLNQMSVANLGTYGITPAEWVSYSAAQQLPVIFKFWQGLANSFNSGRFPPNAAVLTALNFLPGNYKTSGAATNPNAAITSTPSAYYTKNTYYDPSGTGSITLNTIAQRVAMTKASTNSRWKSIENSIANTIPGSSTVPNTPNNAALIAILGGLAIGGSAWWLSEHQATLRRRFRRIRSYV